MNNPRTRNRRGTALIATIWVIIILASTALVLSRSMRVETLAAANRLAQAQAEATERGTEQFLCSVVDQEVATPGSSALVGMEARQVGAGYFWVLKMDPNNQQNRLFGLTDEASKIDLNSATYSATGGGMLQMLPNMPADVAASIYNWTRTNPSPDGLGATDQDYESLPDAYLCKHAPFETTEEVRLVKGVDDNLLFASDTNRDGYLDNTESANGGTAVDSINTSPVGLFPFITAYGQKATKASTSTSSSTGQRAVNVNLTRTGGGPGGGNFNTTALQNALQTAGISNVSGVVLNTTNFASQGRQFSSLLQWAAAVNMTAADLSKLYQGGQVTATAQGGAAGGAAAPAKININTASKPVLMCLPGLEDSDADALIAQRQLQDSSTPTDISWVLTAISDKNKINQIASLLTGTSNVFSADILAISPDGRAFRRFRVVIDGTKAPAIIIYRRDITRYGWPLGTDIRDALRSGNPPPDLNAAATSTNTPLGQGN